MPIKKKIVKEKVEKVVKKLTNKFPDAVIMDGRNVVRTYTKDDHGDDYMILAEGYASRRNYVVNYND